MAGLRAGGGIQLWCLPDACPSPGALFLFGRPPSSPTCCLRPGLRYPSLRSSSMGITFHLRGPKSSLGLPQRESLKTHILGLSHPTSKHTAFCVSVATVPHTVLSSLQKPSLKTSHFPPPPRPLASSSKTSLGFAPFVPKVAVLCSLLLPFCGTNLLSVSYPEAFRLSCCSLHADACTQTPCFPSSASDILPQKPYVPAFASPPLLMLFLSIGLSAFSPLSLPVLKLGPRSPAIFLSYSPSALQGEPELNRIRGSFLTPWAECLGKASGLDPLIVSQPVTPG